MSFIDGFNKIIPYYLNVNVGKNKIFKADPSAKSLLNYKGKLVSFRKRSQTIEELRKYGYGDYETFLPAELVSMPIDIQLNGNQKLCPVIERTSKFTNKEMTFHNIRVLDENKHQIGYVAFSLTPSGDIHDRTSFYTSPDMSERIRHSVYTDVENGEIIKDDAYEFQKIEDSHVKTLGINQRNGKVIACSIIEQDISQLPSESSLNIECSTNLSNSIASCVFDEVDYKKRGGLLLPWECMVLEEDLFSYAKRKDRFLEGLEIIKEKTGVDLNCSSISKTYESIMELDTMTKQELDDKGLHLVKTILHSLAKQAKYLQNRDNNLLKNYKGNYIGNILKITDTGYTACIVTKHSNDKKDYRLYTLVDLSGTSVSQGTGDEELQGIKRDKYYFERLKDARKIPTFVTEILPNGEEKLVFHDGSIVLGDCPEYDRFLDDFVKPFKEIEPISISKVLNKNKDERKDNKVFFEEERA